MTREIKTHNARGYRLPHNTIGTGKRLYEQRRDIALLEAIGTHGLINSASIYGLFPQYSEQVLRTRLRKLCSEKKTRYGDRYLQKHANFRTLFEKSKNNIHLSYSLNPKPAKKLLDRHNIDTTHFLGRSSSLEHDVSLGTVTTSIRIGATKQEDTRYVTRTKILDQAKTHFIFSSKVKGADVDLEPDDLFGIGFPEHNALRLFAVEMDMGNEGVTGVYLDRKTHERNVLQYDQLIGHRGYKKLLGLPRNADVAMMVIYITTNKERMKNMMSITDNNYSLFGYVEEFHKDWFHIIKPVDDLITRPYYRHNRDPFHINTIDGTPPRGIV